MAGLRSVTIPYKPRALQREAHNRTARFGAMVCHRRFGKSVFGVNDLQRGAVTCTKQRPRFAYIGPTYRSAKSIAWDYAKYYARPIPGVSFNESELRIDYPNGGQVRLYGGDDPDSLRGLYFDGVIVDEYGLHRGELFTTVLRPALADRGGWALFLGTPNGKNQFYEICQQAKNEPDWFYACHKASETGIIPEAELQAARKVMTADEYAQEFECSFEAAIKGAIYARELEMARSDGRVTAVPYEPMLPVDTAWDLGVGDTTAIWFFQAAKSGQVRIIDYYEMSGEGLQHYVNVLDKKGYTYGTHWAPHDIQVKELGSGKSRLEVARSLGLNFSVAPNIPIEDGINAARMFFAKCWFDATKCKMGLESLQHYRRDYNTKLQEFKATPVHDFASHGADAWRYLAVSHREKPERRRPSADGPSYPQGAGGWMV